MKAHVVVDVEIHVFLTSALVGGERSASHPGRFNPQEEPPVSIGEENGWTPEPAWMTWRGEKSFPYCDSNSDPSTGQPVVCRPTD
jgi:hypothetical protein